MKLLLGDKQDATLRMIYNHLVERDAVEPIWLDALALVEDLCVDDRISWGTDIDVRWQIAGAEVTPSTTSGVMNLLSHIPPEALQQFAPEDAAYAHSELTAYFLFALSRFRNVINAAWGGSLSGFCHTLPYQWLLIGRTFPGVDVPRSYFGPLDHAPTDLLYGYNTVVSDDVYDGRYWLTGPAQSLSRDEPYLVYDRPSGVPFVVVALDTHLWFHTFEDRIASARAIPSVEKMTIFLMGHFQLRLAELLFFYDPCSDALTFGSIQPGASIQHTCPDEREAFLDAVALALDGG